MWVSLPQQGLSDCTRIRDMVIRGLVASAVTFGPFSSDENEDVDEASCPYQSIPCVVVNDQTRVTTNLLNSNPARNLDSLEIPAEVRAFCSQKQIQHEAEEAIRLVRTYFGRIVKLSFELVRDPEHDEDYMAVHVCVSAQPDVVVWQGRAYLRALRRSIDRNKSKFINVIYHSV